MIMRSPSDKTDQRSHNSSNSYPENERCIQHAIWSPYNGTFEHPHQPHLRYSASTSFTFNRSSEELYFITSVGLAAYARGAITFTNDPNVSIDHVEVEVVASYSALNGLHDVDICTLHKPLSNNYGVGIFVSCPRELIL